MFLNGYPYTDFHELNLDFLLRSMEELKKAFASFTASNSLIFAEPLLHDLSKSYAKNTLVLDPDGNAYISVQAVPVGIQLSDSSYWLMVFNFEEYTEKANKNFTVNYLRDTTRAPQAYAVGDWIVLDDVLYKATAVIAADDLLEVGTNIVHFTVEQFLKDFTTSIVQTVNQYKNDIDASELAYRQQLALDIANTTANLQAQLDVAISGATVDSEVINARVGADGVTYNTLGTAINTQLDNIKNALSSELGYFLIEHWGYIGSSGWTNINSNSTHIVIPVQSGDDFYMYGNASYSTQYGFLKSYTNPVNGAALDYTDDATLTGRKETSPGARTATATIPADTHFVVVVIKNSGYDVAPASIKINGYEYLESFKYKLEHIQDDAFVFRGNVINLGNTTFYACNDIGLYSFGSSNLSSITDKPSDISTGGMLLVYKEFASSNMAQLLMDLNGNVWFRYANYSFEKIIDQNQPYIEVYNVTFNHPLGGGQYYTLATAIAAVPAAKRKTGLKITFRINASEWRTYQFIAGSTADATWNDVSYWQNDTPLSVGNIKWCALGDSITYGYYSYMNGDTPAADVNVVDTWAYTVARTKRMALTNLAVGGTGILHAHSGEDDAGWQIAADTDFSSYDLVTIAFGVNDWKYNEVLGSFDDDFSGTPASIYAALRKTIETILASNPICKIVYITPINCCLNGNEAGNWGISYPYSNNGTLEDIYDAIKTVCEYYGIEMIDMLHESCVNRVNIKDCLLDDVHPSLPTHKIMGKELASKIPFLG